MNVQTTIKQSVPERLARVREVMAREGIDALLVPSADPHLSEYLPAIGRAAAGCPASMGRWGRW